MSLLEKLKQSGQMNGADGGALLEKEGGEEKGMSLLEKLKQSNQVCDSGALLENEEGEEEEEMSMLEKLKQSNQLMQERKESTVQMMHDIERKQSTAHERKHMPMMQERGVKTAATPGETAGMSLIEKLKQSNQMNSEGGDELKNEGEEGIGEKSMLEKMKNEGVKNRADPTVSDHVRRDSTVIDNIRAKRLNKLLEHQRDSVTVREEATAHTSPGR